jgi:hypothetical protein
MHYILIEVRHFSIDICDTSKYFAIEFSGIASFAQERIFLDEQVRFSTNVAIYTELITLRLERGSLSIDRLLSALRFVLYKHAVLRTSLIFNNESSIVEQSITNNHEIFTLGDEKFFENENELQHIMYQTTINPNLLDLSKSRVFYCQILRQQNSIDQNNDNELIIHGDVLMIAFHHATFDRSSRQIFFNDLCSAYNSNTTMSVDEKLFQYIDYAIHEHIMDMTVSSEFWHSQLNGYNAEHLFSSSADRHRSSTDQRSGLASVAKISFDDDILAAFFNYTSSHQVTPFQLGLAIFYGFLFKLIHHQSDLCISCLNANRYRSELQNMIGMFVATLPYRIKLDPYWSFDELIKHVREKCLSILEYSHYPLQHILADSHLNQSNIPFLETLFDFITVSSHANDTSFGDATFEEVTLQQSYAVAKFDVSATFVYNSRANNNKLSCYFVCSRDLFDETTVARTARRFEHLFEQLFSTNSDTALINQSSTSISKLSLILPEEAEELQGVNFRRLETIVDEGK